MARIVFGNIPVNHVYSSVVLKAILTKAREIAGENPELIFAGRWFIKSSGIGTTSGPDEYVSTVSSIVAAFAKKFSASKVVVILDYAELLKAGVYDIDFDEFAERIESLVGRDIEVVVDYYYLFEEGGKKYLVVNGASFGSKGSYDGRSTYYLVDGIVNQFIEQIREGVDTVIIGGLGVDGTTTSMPGLEIIIIPALDMAAARTKAMTTGVLVIKDGKTIPVYNRYTSIPTADSVFSV